MKIRHRTFCIVVVGGIVCLSGCGANSLPSVATMPVVSYKPQESNKLEVLWTHLESADNQIILSGAIRQNRVSPSSTTGHLDIEIRKPDSSILLQTYSETIHIPRHIVGKGPGYKRFRIPLAASKEVMDPANMIVITACSRVHDPITPI